MLGKDSLSFSFMAPTDQRVTFSCIHIGKPVIISAVYSSTQVTKRRDLWANLQVVAAATQRAWICLADFNLVLGAHEKQKGSATIVIVLL